MATAHGIGVGVAAGDGPEPVRRALDLGITLLDSAGGDADAVIGRAIAGRRDEIRVATRSGPSPRAACESALARLGTDAIDLLYLARHDRGVPVEETVGAMAELVREGKVRGLGLADVSAETLAAACAVHPIAALRGDWSLSVRGIEDTVVPVAREHGVAIMASSPLGGPGTAHLVPDAIAASFGCTRAQVALAWLLAQGRDVTPVPVVRSVAELEEYAGAAGVLLGAAELAAIDRAPAAAMAVAGH